MNVAIILLAAGSSSRLGQSKQLLKIDGISLLERSAKIALQANANEVLVVLGSNEKDHQTTIKELPVKIVSNPNWKTGIGSSIKAGLNYLLSLSTFDGVIVMVCDQPLLEADHLQTLMQTFNEKKCDLVASRYADGLGVPVLFSSSIFAELLKLHDHQGAKTIIQNYKNIEALDFPGGDFDIDTIEDYAIFTKGKNSSSA